MKMLLKSRIFRVKVVVFIGMLASLWIPTEYAAATGLLVNSIWLWKL